MSVCASVQLEMHRPGNTNKITGVRALTCIHFILYFTFTASLYDGKYACFHMRDRNSNLFLNAYINRRAHTEYLKTI